MSHQRRRGFARSLVSALAAAAVITTGLASAAQAAPATEPSGTPAPASKIKPDLLSKLQGKDAKEATDFWVRFSAKADLTAASKITDWTQRGTAVAAALKKTAAESQAGVKAELDAGHAKYKTFWATNAISVKGGLAGDGAEPGRAHAEVEGDLQPGQVSRSRRSPQGTTEHQINSVEWGIANIKADHVWSQYGDKGDGIVVANIDTGVQYDHPALVNSYRGNLGNGQFDHNYNWFDAAGTSPNAPADGNGHGTHTMGTMAGDDGAGNQIGVAPGVKWIAANGCCPSDAALISSGQWMLEPTNLAGTNPDASKRPNIINNSWGTHAAVERPVHGGRHATPGPRPGSSGVFANGNSGSGCQTSGSPGSSAEQLLRRRLRHQQQRRLVLRPRCRPERRDQAEHLGPRRQRALEHPRQRLRQLQRHLDGHAAPRGRRRAAVVGARRA